MRVSSWLPASAVLLAAACAHDPDVLDGGQSSADATQVADAAADAGVADALEDAGRLPTYTWWQDVRPIVERRCALCHGVPPLYGAPRSLMEYADTLVPVNGQPTHELMAYRIYARQGRMPPPGQPQLTELEKQRIRVWSEEGAPEGAPEPQDAAVRDLGVSDLGAADGGEADAGAADSSADSGGPPAPDSGEVEDAGAHPDAAPAADAAADAGPVDSGTSSAWLQYTAHAAGNLNQPYPIAPGATSYTCFAFTVQGTGTQYAVGFEPIIDNAQYVHHIFLLHDPTGTSAAGPYSCTTESVDVNLVTAWFPGRGAESLPPGVGYPLQPGSQLIVQIHYSAVNQAMQPDMSGFRVQLTDDPSLTPAGILWQGVEFLTPLLNSDMRQTTCTLSTAITMYSAYPHMHQWGTQISLELRRAGSMSWQTVVDMNPWDFFNQLNVPIDPQFQSVAAGDQLRTTCRWNTMGAPVSWGPGSDNEMCYTFIQHYPLLSDTHLCVVQQ